MQSADVRLHVGATGDNFAHMVLHIAPAAGPKIAATAERWNVVEVWVLAFDPLELVAVVDAVLVAGAENQPIFVAVIAFWLLEQPMNYAADGRDAGSGGDEDRVFAEARAR